jgi:hypothetical protein
MKKKEKNKGDKKQASLCGKPPLPFDGRGRGEYRLSQGPVMCSLL